MSQASAFQQNTKLNRYPMLHGLAIALAALAPLACQSSIEKQPQPIAEPSTTTKDARPASSGGSPAIDVPDKATCLVPGPFEPYFPNEEALVFKSTPDTKLPYYDPSVCKTAPFEPTFSAGGRMTSVLYRLDDAYVGNPQQREVGYGTLCLKVQDPTFKPFGQPLLAYGKLIVNGMAMTVNGTCTITNSDMPAAKVSQMVCGLPLVAPIPAGHVGGVLNTNSVLNMGNVPGLSGGSILSLHLYKGSAQQSTTPVPSATVAPSNPKAQ